jgi:hypothetical protein
LKWYFVILHFFWCRIFIVLLFIMRYNDYRNKYELSDI